MIARALSIAAFGAALGFSAGPAAAQSNAFTPAELPPGSYTGNQYVDSAGCVFIRAGYGDRVTWVPRFGDDRQPMCGMQPTFAAAPQPQPVQQPQPEPVVVRTAAASTAPAPSAARSVAPAAGSVGIHAACPSHAPYGTRVQRDGRAMIRCTASPQPAGAATQPEPIQVASAETACPNLSPHSQQYMRPSPARPDLPVRCGPQDEHPADAVRRMSPTGGVWEPYTGTPPLSAPNVYQIPPGYQPVWRDGRLNPDRARGTARGDAQMRLVWTDTVPRRLVNPATGEDVTERYAHLVQPYPAQAAQQRTGAAPQVHVSTLSPAPAAPSAAASGRFVQVGAFGVPDNAQNAAARLQAAGLPVQVRRGGNLQLVLAGPFADGATLAQALAASRQLGFSDAFTRN